MRNVTCSTNSAWSINETPIKITTHDGYRLAAIVFENSMSQPPNQPIAIIGGGVAIPQTFYAPFARYLASQGTTVITFDYRGIGGSLNTHARDITARLVDWGQKDIPAILAYAKSTYPDSPIHWIGHSLGGGFGVALAHNNALIDRHLGIAVPHGYWGLMSGNERYRVAALIGIVLPTLAYTCGYIPGKLTGLGENLPKHIALEWRRWILNPNSMWGSLPAKDLTASQTLRAPMHILRFSDDPWASEQSVEQILKCFTGAKHRSIACIQPQDANAKHIGHNGFFRTRFATTLWPRACAWLNQSETGLQQSPQQQPSSRH